MITEKPYRAFSGWLPLVLILGSTIGGPVLFVASIIKESPIPTLCGAGLFIAGVISLFGFIAVPPNEARVLLLFGTYRGTVNDSGFFWVNPFFSKKKLSVRVRNFETGSTTTPEEKNEMGKVVKASTRSSGRPSKAIQGQRSRW